MEILITFFAISRTPDINQAEDARRREGEARPTFRGSLSHRLTVSANNSAAYGKPTREPRRRCVNLRWGLNPQIGVLVSLSIAF